MDVPKAVSSDVSSTIDATAFDEPYRFGRRPTVEVPFPFSVRQLGRLLVARSRVQAELSADDQLALSI